MRVTIHVSKQCTCTHAGTVSLSHDALKYLRDRICDLPRENMQLGLTIQTALGVQ